MTFRTRVLIACLLASVAPLAVLTFGIRQEVDRTVTAQYRARVEGLMAVIREDMVRQNRATDERRVWRRTPAFGLRRCDGMKALRCWTGPDAPCRWPASTT